eukprot:Hpha_TRINITY_DN17433_c0_g1::TRINITY_DN17433_c0_g1_i1::g.85863::m.85863
MKLLYITMEYANGQFSGNGTASMSFVRSLRAQGDAVTVLCAGPTTDDTATPDPSAICIPVDSSSWGIHGRTGPFEEFASACAGEEVQAQLAQHGVIEKGGGGKPLVDLVVGVDFEGCAAYFKMVEEGVLPSSTPLVYYNYRVFHRNTGNTPDDTAFYASWEARCLNAAALSLCLCETDATSLAALPQGHHHPPRPRPSVILPGLRTEIKRVALEGGDQSTSSSRRHLLCCVRVVKEKNTMAFAEAVGMLRDMGLIGEGESQVVPYMVGAVADEAYGGSVFEVLRGKEDGCIVKGFVGAGELAGIMQSSVLNVHPALNEAYGMTIVEAAAMGCPSIVHHSDIGAADLLSPSADPVAEAFACDMADPAGLARSIAGILAPSNATVLRDVAEAARAKALSYDEAANAKVLRSHLLSMASP